MPPLLRAGVVGPHSSAANWKIWRPAPAISRCGRKELISAPRLIPTAPGPLVALVLAIVIEKIRHLPAATIGGTFGGAPHQLPALHLPDISLSKLIELVRPAFAIALPGAIESLLSAVVWPVPETNLFGLPMAMDWLSSFIPTVQSTGNFVIAFSARANCARWASIPKRFCQKRCEIGVMRRAKRWRAEWTQASRAR